MAPFKDVFSITAKVLLALLIIGAIIGIGFIPVLPPDPEKVRAAQEETRRVEARIQAESERDLDEAKLELWVARYGDSVAAKMYQCKHDPPKRPGNQEWCRRMFASDAKADADYDAKEKRERDKW